MDNMEHADDIADRTDRLAEQAKVFETQSRAVHYNERCKAYKMYAIIAAVAAVLIIIIVVLLVR